MTTLLVDIGNTRVKWALLRGARLTRMRARAHARRAAVLRAVVDAAPRDVERVIAVCVAGASLERALGAAVRSRFGVRVEFVRSARHSAGVRNGYRDTWRLGADRWVSVIAAHALARGRPALIANIGTALTLDAVTGNGRHLGGAIAPGPATMTASLLAGTHGIRRRARGAVAGRPVRAPCLHATPHARSRAGPIMPPRHSSTAPCRRPAPRSARRPLLILTGGAGNSCDLYRESGARGAGPGAARARGPRARIATGHLLHSRLACVSPSSCCSWSISRSSRGRSGSRPGSATPGFTQGGRAAPAACHRNLTDRRQWQLRHRGAVRHQRTRGARAPDVDRQRLSLGATRASHQRARWLLGISREPVHRSRRTAPARAAASRRHQRSPADRRHRHAQKFRSVYSRKRRARSRNPNAWRSLACCRRSRGA